MNHIPSPAHSPFGGVLRERPANVAAETALLGGLLMNSVKGLPLVEDLVEPEHFYLPLYGEIYAEIRRLVQAGGVADPPVVAPKFRHHDALNGEDVGKVLAGLLSAFVGLPCLPDYATAIREAWLMRSIFDVCVEAGDLCSRPGQKTAEDVRDYVENGLLRIAQGCGESRPVVQIGAAIGQAIENARAAAKRQDGLAGVTWGYRGMDRMTGGLHRSDLTLLGARPAMGKTALGLGIAARSAAAGNSVLFWSGEMRAAQLGARAGAAWAGISTLSVFTGRRYDVDEEIADGPRPVLEDYHWRALAEGERAASDLPLFIDDRPGITVAQLRARARRMKRQKRGLDLIVADYVGLLRASETTRRFGLREAMTEISADLKNLAAELEIPILALAQLSREAAKRDDKRPELTDLRETGALEQDAATVVFAHREHYYLEKAISGDEIPRRMNESEEAYRARCEDLVRRAHESKGKAELILAKNRHGPTGLCRMQFDNTTTWFRDAGEDPRSAAWVNTGPEF